MHKRKAFTYALFAAIAVALIFSSYFIRNVLRTTGNPDIADFVAEILIQVGLVVGAIALVDWLWGLVGGEPLAAQNDFELLLKRFGKPDDPSLHKME